jgi:hypothetical protein
MPAIIAGQAITAVASTVRSMKIALLVVLFLIGSIAGAMQALRRIDRHRDGSKRPGRRLAEKAPGDDE